MRHLETVKLGELRVKPHIARLDLSHVPFHHPHAGYDHTSCREEVLEALETSWTHIDGLA